MKYTCICICVCVYICVVCAGVGSRVCEWRFGCSGDLRQEDNGGPV